MPQYGPTVVAPALSPLRAAEAPGLRDELNRVLVELRGYLRGLPRFFVREPFRYRQGDTILLDVDLHRPPTGVLVIRALQADALSTSPTCSAVPSWIWNQETGTVAISNIDGLTAGTDYLVTLLVVE